MASYTRGKVAAGIAVAINLDVLARRPGTLLEVLSIVAEDGTTEVVVRGEVGTAVFLSEVGCSYLCVDHFGSVSSFMFVSLELAYPFHQKVEKSVFRTYDRSRKELALVDICNCRQLRALVGSKKYLIETNPTQPLPMKMLLGFPSSTPINCYQLFLLGDSRSSSGT